MSVLDRFDAMVKAGVPYETALELARGFEADVEAAVIRGAQAVAATIKVDAQAQRRREKDRERKAANPSIPQNSADSAETLSEGSQGSLSPTPPNLPNPPNLSQVPPIVPQKTARKARLGPAKGAFAKFWAEYPLKVGKLAAERAYAKAWGVVLDEDPDADPEAQILAGLVRCKPLFDPEFIQHPTTWLNKGGWMDQPEVEAIDGGTGPPKFDLAKFDAERAAETRRLEALESAA